MNHKVGKIRNIRTIKALRGDPLTIDLGKTFDGELTAWMKKGTNSSSYRSFDILNNRYLSLTRTKTSDIYEGEALIEEIAGKWYFDVEFLKNGDTENNKKTIYTGTVFFINDITGSNGVNISEEEVYSFQFNNTSNNILDIDLITDEFLENNGTLQVESELLIGKNVTLTNVGRYGFVINTSNQNLYNIFDVFGNNITSIVFDKSFDSENNKLYYISKNFSTPASIFFKFKK